MERDCPKYNELSSILGDRCKDAARPYNTGQNSEALVLYHPPENPMVSFPDEKEAPLVSSTSRLPSHSEPSPAPGPSFSFNRPSTPNARSHKGKKRVIDTVILGTDNEWPSQIAKIGEMYLSGSLAIQEKESKARVMVDHIERSGKEHGLDPKEIQKNVSEALDIIYAIHN